MKAQLSSSSLKIYYFIVLKFVILVLLSYYENVVRHISLRASFRSELICSLTTIKIIVFCNFRWFFVLHFVVKIQSKNENNSCMDMNKVVLLSCEWKKWKKTKREWKQVKESIIYLFSFLFSVQKELNLFQWLCEFFLLLDEECGRLQWCKNITTV